MGRLLVPAGIAVILGANLHGSAAQCPAGNAYTIQQAYCMAAHACRADYAISSAEFEQQFGADPEACQSLDLPFVDSVLANASGPGDPELSNCLLAIGSVQCDEIVTDALLDPGRACDPEVIAGRRSTAEQYSCADTPAGCCE